MAPEILIREKQERNTDPHLNGKKRINNKYKRKIKYLISLHSKDCDQMLTLDSSHRRIRIFITDIKADLKFK